MSTDIEFPVMPGRCETCAYRAGTQASKSELTLLKANLCLETGEVFLCHEDPAEIGICKGWADALTKRYEKGIPFEDTGWRRALKLELTDLICNYEEAVKNGKPFDYAEEMRSVLERASCSPYEFAPRKNQRVAVDANKILEYLKEIEMHCPCGARPESLRTHPHVGGCPVSKAIRYVEQGARLRDAAGKE